MNELDQARRLHRDAIVINAHDHMLGLEDHLAMRGAGVTAKTLHVSLDVVIWDDEPDCYAKYRDVIDGYADRARRTIDLVRAQIDAHPGELLLVRCADDILDAHRTGRAGIILGFEGAKPLEDKLERLDEFYELGVRYIQLTWAVRNHVSTGFDPDAGLTPFGRDVVRRMNELGMVIDVAHIGEKAWHEVAELSSHPIIAGHCGVSALTLGRSEITDERLRLIAATGGVVGLHAVAHIMHPTGKADWEERATVDHIVDHADYIRDHAGIDHVALGPDFFPNDEHYRRAIGYNVVYADGLRDVGGLPNLTAAFLRRGYSEDDVRKVLGGNLLRVYREVLRIKGVRTLY